MNIKNAFCIITTLITVLSFTSCTKGGSDIPTSPSSLEPLDKGSIEEALSPPSDPDIVSPLSKKYYLDLDELSFIREAPVQYVMIHFCSDVVNNRTYPYGMEAIRRTLIKNKASINYIIARNGEIYCYVPEQRVAFHAGKGSYGDEKYTDSMDEYSIGISLVAIGSKNDMKDYLSGSKYNSVSSSLRGFTDAQYEALSLLLKDIAQRWDIPLDREHIIGHSDYNSGNREPGELFNWERVLG